MLTAFLRQTCVSIFPLGLKFIGFHQRHFHATSTWHIWQILEFLMKNKKAGWNHSKATIINFYYRFQTSKTHFVTRERAHSRDRLQKESWFLQISPFHACYFCLRDRLLARDISRIFIKRDSQYRKLRWGPSSSVKPYISKESILWRFFKEKCTKINGYLPEKVSIFGSKQESFPPRLLQNNVT